MTDTIIDIRLNIDIDSRIECQCHASGVINHGEVTHRIVHGNCSEFVCDLCTEHAIEAVCESIEEGLDFICCVCNDEDEPERFEIIEV